MKIKTLFLFLFSITASNASVNQSTSQRITAQEKLVSCSMLERIIDTYHHSKMNSNIKSKLLNADLNRAKLILGQQMKDPHANWTDQTRIKGALFTLEYSSVQNIVNISIEAVSLLGCRS